MSCPQSFTCSQQFLSHAGKLLHAHMGGVLSSLAIRRLGIGHHRQLFDGGTQLLLLHSTFVRITAGAGYWSRSSASARSHRSLVLHRPDSGFHTVHMQCERVRQKMSHAFFTPFGKTCRVFLPVILAKDVANTLRQEVTLLSKLYLLFFTIGNAS